MKSLREYLEKTDQSVAAFAGRVGVSRAYMSQIMNGRKTPSLKVAAKISIETGGVIPVTHWLKEDE